jgi:8-oxo-dGTP pyrophosphatase MutT (NUDIX family)
VLTKRSEALSSHRGEVALPGGKKDPEDETVIHTALRESHEEISLPPSEVDVIGQLDAMVTRFGVKVSPVVGLIQPAARLVPNPDELDAVFKVPLDFFLQDKRLRTDVGTVGDHKVMVPAWEYDGYEIWGVTAVILTQLMNNIFGMSIETGMENLPRGRSAAYKPQDWRPVKGRKGITE